MKKLVFAALLSLSAISNAEEVQDDVKVEWSTFRTNQVGGVFSWSAVITPGRAFINALIVTKNSRQYSDVDSFCNIFRNVYVPQDLVEIVLTVYLDDRSRHLGKIIKTGDKYEFIEPTPVRWVEWPKAVSASAADEKASISYDCNSQTLSVNVSPNTVFAIEECDDLTKADWQPVGTDRELSESSRFYRVITK